LAGAAYEGYSLLVLVGARTLADEDQGGMFIAGSENDLMAAFVKAAAMAIADVVENFEKGARRCGRAFRLRAGREAYATAAVKGGDMQVPVIFQVLAETVSVHGRH
jgi:hypothetical protein